MNSLTNSNNTITIDYTTIINATFLFGGYPRCLIHSFFRNEVYKSLNTDNVMTERLYDNEIAHQLSYIDTDETVGHFVYMETTYTHSSDVLKYNCQDNWRASEASETLLVVVQ